MPYILTVNHDRLADNPELAEEIDAFLFRKNFHKYALIQKNKNYDYKRPWYDLHFTSDEDAFYFKLRYAYCLVEDAQS